MKHLLLAAFITLSAVSLAHATCQYEGENYYCDDDEGSTVCTDNGGYVECYRY